MKAKIKPRINLSSRTNLNEVIPLSVPFVVYVDPSDSCNFRCNFCPTGDRELMRKTPGRNHRMMSLSLFKKIIDDICEFDNPLKVLRLYKDGEPLMNPYFSKMVKYAKNKNCALSVDTTTNASLLSPQKNIEIVEAGLDRINISIIGVNQDQYEKFSRFKIDFEKMVDNIAHLYEHRRQCEIIIKINGDTVSEADISLFFKIFGDIADGLYVEHVMSCWPGFDLLSRQVAVNQELGIYGQPIKEVEVCPYIFYSISVNTDGSVSSCFLDWSRKLVVGNIVKESLKDIWEGDKMNELRILMLEKKRNQHSICCHCGQMSHGMPDDIDASSALLLKKMNV